MVQEPANDVVRARRVDKALLLDFLNDMTALETLGCVVDVDRPSPEAWGTLVLARSDVGGVLDIDPQLYWEGIASWFRAEGDDPHPWRRRG